MELKGINTRRVAKTYQVTRTDHPVVFTGSAKCAVEWFYAAVVLTGLQAK